MIVAGASTDGHKLSDQRSSSFRAFDSKMTSANVCSGPAQPVCVMSVEQKQPNHVERPSTAKLSALLLTCFTTLIVVFWAQHQVTDEHSAAADHVGCCYGRAQLNSLLGLSYCHSRAIGA